MAKKTKKRVARRTGKKSVAATQSARVIRVFAKQKLSRELANRVAAPPPSGFDRAVTLEGGTQHFQAYFQTGFANGPAIAQGVLMTCEKDYDSILGFFSGLVPPTFPMNIIVAPGIGGAYHYGCAAVDLYCDGDASAGPDIDHTRYLVIAEEVEVFEAAQNKGWNCGASNGEGLSRVLATELYPAELDGFFTAASWLDSNRPDWVTQRTRPTRTRFRPAAPCFS
ncbi:MAG TPA: hypothetical protein VNF00_00680 [Candidatus Acidoferrales bacterium]|nr:hypothetical protein [Candidatus Acidoferrales bacterium]